MKSQLIAIVAAVLVGCGESQQSALPPEVEPAEPVAVATQPEPSTAKTPDISIHDAAYDGNIEAVQHHIAAGTDVNADDGGGVTPLHFAASIGHKEVAALLIAEGADVNAKNEDGQTPLDFTSVFNKTKTADLLRKHGGKHSSIHKAAVGGDAEGVKEFLDAGTDVNEKDDSEWTPLFHATIWGHKEIVELLIAEGANVNYRFNFTPLHLGSDHKEISELLIAEGADVNAKDFEGDTPLDAVVDPEIAKLFRKHGGKTGEELKAERK